ncbi:ABC transporter ATP-binding protein [Aquisalibacillus elongatus]|uniref:ABC-2 type transport system ATP-binding protein n=1 Tax=Aquisalibacillus elongatus TaxID=485577 RepID=A0A3N5BU27_9BACI|nr:ABC transporter ATP-binding protein [Aquisalibacillus elongatus]RPF53288.1 ABC-2 type transport system ATP-binding protein [Aquisalibacillus elongatus]
MSVLNVNIEQAGYSEEHRIIRDIVFQVRKGELIGLIGPNGAGKSTTIKSILGTIDYLEGSVCFENNQMKYAYIPEQPVFYEELTLWEHIQFVASVREWSENEMTQRVLPLLKTFRLEERVHELPVTFSKGMQQKLMIVLAMLNDPSLYIIDEPFVGLDPKAINDFLRLLNEKRQEGAAVLMTTHMLDTAERICDRIILLMDGEILTQGKIDDIHQKAGMDQGSLFDSFEVLMERST